MYFENEWNCFRRKSTLSWSKITKTEKSAKYDDIWRNMAVTPRVAEVEILDLASLDYPQQYKKKKLSTPKRSR